MRIANERHCRESLHTRAAEELKQDCFCLIVGVVREHDQIGAHAPERRVACLTRRPLGAVAARDAYFRDAAANTTFAAQLTAEASPLRRFRAELMVDVQSFERKSAARREPHKDVQQNDGIDSARKTYDEPIASLDDGSHTSRDVLEKVAAFTWLRLP
jgi:hypothetical protein